MRRWGLQQRRQQEGARRLCRMDGSWAGRAVSVSSSRRLSFTVPPGPHCPATSQTNLSPESLLLVYHRRICPCSETTATSTQQHSPGAESAL